MMLAHPLLQSPIEFKENRIPILVVENGQLFRRLIADLLAKLGENNGTDAKQ